MGEDLSTAMTLLVIGMITVFVVLFLVYVTGTGLIILVNRYFSDTSPEKPAEGVRSSTVAVITAAVDVVTGGKASITNIEKEI